MRAAPAPNRCLLHNSSPRLPFFRCTQTWAQGNAGERLHRCILYPFAPFPQSPATAAAASALLLQFRSSSGVLQACRHILDRSHSLDARWDPGQRWPRLLLHSP